MKTLDELMQHLCDNGIACSGELQKRELKNRPIDVRHSFSC